MDDIQRLALQTIEMNKQAIIFVPTRASAEKTAEEIAKLTNFHFPEFEKEVLSAASTPTKQCRRLSHCIKKGIAFHHAGLLSSQKELIETEFRKGNVKIICCTPTLAAGISMPAFRVIIKSLKRFTGSWGQDWIPVLEYLQMAGRAGRPEYEKFGEAICIAKDEAEQQEIYNKYVCGVPEEIYSKLAAEPVLRTYVLSLIASGIISNMQSMRDFFAKTFWAHQFKDMPKLVMILEKMTRLLQDYTFIDAASVNDDFVTANTMGQGALRATLLGKRVSQLYLDPLTARKILDALQRYDQDKNTFSILQMISHTLEMRPLLRMRSKDEEFIQAEINKRYNLFLSKEPSIIEPEYEEFLHSVKTALFFEAWIEERDEDYLLQTFDIAPGEIRVKLDVADWLLYAAEELAKITHADARILKDLMKLRVRIQYGIKEDILNLIQLKGIGRVRARKLAAHGLRDLGDLKKVDITSLGQILGKLVAEDVKKQLGENVAQVSDSKRKGQLSIGKFG